MRTTTWLWVGLLVGGCGGGSGGASGEPLTDAEAQALCEDVCEHYIECAWQSDMVACVAGCAAEADLFRGDGYTGWGECLMAAECTTGNPGEECYVETADAIDARDVHEQYVAACTALSGSCPSVTLPSGVCDVDQVILFSDAYMQETVLPCFDLACDQVVDCVETTVLDAF